MTVGEMLTHLDLVIGDARARRLRRRAVVLTLTGPTVLGVTGRAYTDEHGQVVYGFTLAQACRIRAAILAAAREDLAGMREAGVLGEPGDPDV